MCSVLPQELRSGGLDVWNLVQESFAKGGFGLMGYVKALLVNNDL